ncbi:hypothetical protein [Desertivirga xinjiangensis]|uniref:hypothetical protein n=1 Tax=Desertivirga xinjiangensis TaxID=539206 RepID=UPI002108E0D5|nr:hypothetical protein [Pedobacter xinjiangensis]
MSKVKNKTLIKSARKNTRKELEVNINAHLKEVIGNLGHESKKVTKEINKASKQLAKKLAGIVRIDKTIVQEIKKASTETSPEEGHAADFSTPEPLPEDQVKTGQTLQGESKGRGSKKPVISNSPSIGDQNPQAQDLEQKDQVVEAENKL